MAGPGGVAARPGRTGGAGLLASVDWTVVGMVALGAAIRLGWVLHQRHAPLSGDPYYYHHEADLVAHGKGFIEPIRSLVNGSPVADAAHPPLFVLYLAAWTLVGAGSVFWHLIASALLGTATVAVLGQAGRRLGGRRVGILAGFLAAVAPNLWVWDGVLAAETMAIFAVALFVLAVVRYLASPSRAGLACVAGAAALAGLSRAELALLIFAVIPLVLRTEGIGRRVRFEWLAASALVVALLIGPWAAYNQGRFKDPVVLSTGLGLVLVSSNCDAAYYGGSMGYWNFGCSAAGTTAARGYEPLTASGVSQHPIDNSLIDGKLRHVAFRYMAEHPTRLPAVVAARLGRVTGLYRPIQQAQLQDTNEGAPRWITGSIMSTWYLFAGLALLGARRLRRAGVPLVALGAPVLVVLFTTAISYGIGRFRAPSETVIVVLAAVGIDLLVRHRWEGDAPPDPDGLVTRFEAEG